MIEIIALFFLLRNLGNVAQKKGQSATRWIIRGLINWVVFEFLGAGIGLMLFGQNNLISILLLGLMGGFAGYHLTFIRLKNLPDNDEGMS